MGEEETKQWVLELCAEIKDGVKEQCNVPRHKIMVGPGFDPQRGYILIRFRLSLRRTRARAYECAVKDCGMSPMITGHLIPSKV